MRGIYLDDTPDHIKGISCSVKNCVYHTGDSKCMAGNIQIGSQNACSCSETVCATFELNSDAAKY